MPALAVSSRSKYYFPVIEKTCEIAGLSVGDFLQAKRCEVMAARQRVNTVYAHRFGKILGKFREIKKASSHEGRK